MSRVIFQNQPYDVRIAHQSDGKFKNRIQITASNKYKIFGHVTGDMLSTKRHRKLLDSLMRLFDYEVGTRCTITKITDENGTNEFYEAFVKLHSKGLDTFTRSAGRHKALARAAKNFFPEKKILNEFLKVVNDKISHRTQAKSA